MNDARRRNFDAPLYPLTGKVAVVTGGSSGIGAAAAEALARDGANVVLVGREGVRLAAVVEHLRRVAAPLATVMGLALDVAREDDMNCMTTAALETFGRIDVLVAAAGTLRGDCGWARQTVELTIREWNEVIATNLTGVFLSNRAVLPAMARQGSGEILNVSSTSGLQGLAYDAAYSASKFGVIGLSEAIAEEASSYGVRVHALLPGAIDTPMWRSGDAVPHLGPALPAQRVGELVRFVVSLPDDVELMSLVVTPAQTAGRPPGIGRAQLQ